MVQRRPLITAAGLAAWGGVVGHALATPSASAPAAGVPTTPATPGLRVLRTAYAFAETGFDPPQVSDTSSSTTLAHIFEPPLSYDPLAHPAKLVPLTAAALPEASADFRHSITGIGGTLSRQCSLRERSKSLCSEIWSDT